MTERATARKPRRTGARMPVICVETRHEFPSIKAAAAWAKSCPSGVWASVNSGTLCKGFHFARFRRGDPLEYTPKPSLIRDEVIDVTHGIVYASANAAANAIANGRRAHTCWQGITRAMDQRKTYDGCKWARLKQFKKERTELMDWRRVELWDQDNKNLIEAVRVPPYDPMPTLIGRGVNIYLRVSDERYQQTKVVHAQMTDLEYLTLVKEYDRVKTTGLQRE